jgi:hypothetical protein
LRCWSHCFAPRTRAASSVAASAGSDAALRRWARRHPAMVLAGVLLPLKLALFLGLAWLVLANL